MHQVAEPGTNGSDRGSGAAGLSCSHLIAGPKLPIVISVRVFGGVIVGAAAEEISKSLGLSDRYDASTDRDRDDSAIESFSATAGSTDSSSWQGREASYEAAQQAVHTEQLSIRRNDVCKSLSHRSVGGLKRKLSERSVNERGRCKGTFVRVDATPKAPDERAALKVIVNGQGCTSFVSECQLPTDRGQFRLRAYRYLGKDKSHEPVVMIAGDIRGKQNVPVRVHDQCQTSEVLGSKRCDCREQLDLSLCYIQENGGGAVIYLQQEGRGIGLANKVAAYALQDNGLDTVDANRKLGFGDDERSYECVDFILRDMGVQSVELMTNNPFKMDWLRATGVNVEGRIPVKVASNKHNKGYLEAKALRMGHLINSP